jgi:hypothetical protein
MSVSRAVCQGWLWLCPYLEHSKPGHCKDLHISFTCVIGSNLVVIVERWIQEVAVEDENSICIGWRARAVRQAFERQCSRSEWSEPHLEVAAFASSPDHFQIILDPAGYRRRGQFLLCFINLVYLASLPFSEAYSLIVLRRSFHQHSTKAYLLPISNS